MADGRRILRVGLAVAVVADLVGLRVTATIEGVAVLSRVGWAEDVPPDGDGDRGPGLDP